MSCDRHSVIPGREPREELDGFVKFERAREPGIYNHCTAYGFRACPTRRLRLNVVHPGMTNCGAA